MTHSLLLSLFLVAAPLAAQDRPRDCAATLEGFRTKIEQNYAGAHLELVGERFAAVGAVRRTDDNGAGA